jgi:diguanylate cyclase (GGDEF)-like protein
MQKESAVAPPPHRLAPGPYSPYVLIAEYDLKRAVIYRQLIIDEGCSALIVRDGDEARRLLHSHGAPILLISELSLPAADGFAVLKELRQIAPADEVAAIVLSASAELRTVAWSLREDLGIRSVLARSASWTELRETIRAALAEPLGQDGNDTKRSAESESVYEVLRGVVANVSRIFRVPITAAYARLAQKELFASHVSLEGPPPDLEISQQWGFLQQVLAAGAPLIVPDARNHPLYREQPLVQRGVIRGFAGTPLLTGAGESTGALCVVDTGVLSLGVHDLDALQTMVEGVGRDLERRARSRRTEDGLEVHDLSRLAVTDPLTGVANRRGGEKSIVREVSRAQRHGTPLSVVLMDIDRFKAINETHGHAAGDRSLREVCRTVSDVVRGSDLAIRWGGDEILLVLPGIERQGATVLADRVRQRVEALHLPDVGPITVSAGVAQFEGSRTFEEVFADAEKSLYEAKRGGRNRVV